MTPRGGEATARSARNRLSFILRVYFILSTSKTNLSNHEFRVNASMHRSARAYIMPLKSNTSEGRIDRTVGCENSCSSSMMHHRMISTSVNPSQRPQLMSNDLFGFRFARGNSS